MVVVDVSEAALGVLAHHRRVLVAQGEQHLTLGTHDPAQARGIPEQGLNLSHYGRVAFHGPYLDLIDLIVECLDDRQVPASLALGEAGQHEVRAAFGKRRPGLGLFGQPGERRHRVLVERDQEVGAHEGVQLDRHEAIIAPAQAVQHDEEVLPEVLNLGEMRFVDDVLSGQPIEPEALAQGHDLGDITASEVQPEPSGAGPHVIERRRVLLRHGPALGFLVEKSDHSTIIRHEWAKARYCRGLRAIPPPNRVPLRQGAGDVCRDSGRQRVFLQRNTRVLPFGRLGFLRWVARRSLGRLSPLRIAPLGRPNGAARSAWCPGVRRDCGTLQRLSEPRRRPTQHPRHHPRGVAKGALVLQEPPERRRRPIDVTCNSNRR